MTGTTGSLVNTLFVGAPTRVGKALNDFVRLQGPELRASGVFAVRNKDAIYALRSAIGDAPESEPLDALLDAASGRALFLSALFALGRPATVLRDNMLLPQAERMLGGIAKVLEGRIDRVVLAIEPVHHLLLSVGGDDADLPSGRVRWEALYEVSWGEMVDVIGDCFPGSELVVLTPHTARSGAAPVLHHLFGGGGFELADEPGGLALVEACRLRYEVAEIKAKTGLDQVACDLLDARFREDLDMIAVRPGVRVF